MTAALEIPQSYLKDLYQIWHLNPASTIFPETFERFIRAGHYVIIDADGKKLKIEDALLLLPAKTTTTIPA